MYGDLMNEHAEKLMERNIFWMNHTDYYSDGAKDYLVAARAYEEAGELKKAEIAYLHASTYGTDALNGEDRSTRKESLPHRDDVEQATNKFRELHGPTKFYTKKFMAFLDSVEHKKGYEGLRKAEEEFQKSGEELFEKPHTKRDKKKKDLDSLLSLIISIAGLGAGIFFLSSNLTGNVTGNLNPTSSNGIGIILFIIGIVGAFVYFRKNRIS